MSRNAACYDVGMRCDECGEVIPVRSGRVPRFCSGACRQRAYRARKRAERAAVPVLPARMTGVRRWVRAVGKRPFRVDGRWASSTKDWTWASFDEVQSGFGDGMGVMLGDGLACLDLDNCFDDDGSLLWWADEALMDVPSPLWVERSVSGNGLHVFFECPEGAGRVRKYGAGEVALYSRARFILVTGDYFKL